MTTDNQRQQLIGYTQAVQEMSGLIQEMVECSSIAKEYLEKLESEMRHNVLKLIEGQE